MMDDTGVAARGDKAHCYIVAAQLMVELLDDAQCFARNGKALELLKCYFDGYPVPTLRFLLRSEVEQIRAVGAFVASELGGQATEVVDDMIPLMSDAAPRVCADAMDVVAVCATGRYVDRYTELVKMLDSKIPAVQSYAEHLVSRADASQREATRRYFRGVGRLDLANQWGGDEKHRLEADK